MRFEAREQVPGEAQGLSELFRILSSRIVVAGVGVVGRGDDGFGPLLVNRLAGIPGITAIDCGDRLEDFSAEVASAKPEVVLVADAVDMRARPGAIALLEPEDLGRFTSGSTHDASLEVVLKYLAMRTGAPVKVLAVQPAVVSSTPVLSPEVSEAVESIVRVFQTVKADGC